jgi:regulator of sigma E protease
MVVLQYIIAIIGFSLIIIVHEFGHFVFAKAGGMYVQEFFIGFGPTIFKVKSKPGTEYGLRAIPVGGYVKILGMDRNEEVPDSQKSKSYQTKPFYKKFFAIFGGAGFNVLFAIILIMIFLSMGVLEPSTTIDYIQEDSPAEEYGFNIGDTVIAIDGEEINTWDEFAEKTQNKPGEKVTYTVERGGKQIKVEAVLDVVDGKGFLGISPGYIEKKLGFTGVIKESFRMVWDIIVTYIKLFGMLFSGKIPFEQARPVSPIGVVSIFQQSISLGIQNFILFIALVSILIGFGNLIPILPLDGGNIVLLIVETIRKKPVPRKVLEVANYFGVFLMVSLLLIGFIYDIISPFDLTEM